jgi:hypothetical protein
MLILLSVGFVPFCGWKRPSLLLEHFYRHSECLFTFSAQELCSSLWRDLFSISQTETSPYFLSAVNCRRILFSAQIKSAKATKSPRKTRNFRSYQIKFFYFNTGDIVKQVKSFRDFLSLGHFFESQINKLFSHLLYMHRWV